MGCAACKTELYRRRRSAGLCVQCGTDAGGKSKCASCAEKDKAARQRRREKRKAASVCTECGQPSKEGCALCQACIDKCSKVSIERYHRNKAAGVCPYCGAETSGAFMCEKCKIAGRESKLAWYHRRAQTDLCVRCSNPRGEKSMLCPRCYEQQKALEHLRNEQRRAEVFKAYGGPKCARCSETDQDVLQIDHIDGGGRKHLKKIGGQLYRWLQEQGYPEGFQVLCANCNIKKYRMEARAGRKTLVK